jgi:hypothetical protein
MRRVAHDRPRGDARLGERYRVEGAERHPAFLTGVRVLGEVGLAAACGHPHAEPLLLVVEDKPVSLTGLASETCNPMLGEVHCREIPSKGRGPPADPVGLHDMTGRGGLCQKISLAETAIARELSDPRVSCHLVAESGR